MKVLQILPELNAGGVERGTLELAAWLMRAGHEAVVVSNGGQLVPELERCGARHLAMPVHRKSPASLFQVRSLRRLLEQEKPDIVHYRSRVPGWITWLAWRRMNPSTRPRLVSTVHGFNSVNAYSAIMMRGERVICVSRAVRDFVQQNYPKTPAENLRVIPRGIAPALYHAGWQPSPEWTAQWRRDFPQLESKTVLLLPGRITRLKGHADFFELTATLKAAGVPVHGLVAGGAHENKKAYHDELLATVAARGLANDITFTGHRSDLREIMAVSDIVFNLTQQPESFGRTVLEAVALGKPAIGYDCGGVGEILAALYPQGRVPPQNAAALLETTRRILAERPAPLPVGEPYTVDAMCRSTFAVYLELAGDRLAS
jgi:glycosyltransferase involved in cell wall biosynthesis